ncbi:MAG: hypothetical protein RLZZ175_1285 [Bacteroidota bacterium]|jgi:hypothetical protein
MIYVIKLNKKINQNQKQKINKMRYTNFIFILLLINSTLVVAQPGYLGKTLSVNYDFNTSPILSGVSYKGNSSFLTSYNSIHSIRVDKVNSRKGSIGLQLGFTRSSLYDMSLITPDLYKTFDNGYPYKLSTYKLGINFRTFGQDDACLAPFGQYFEFGLGVANNIVKDAVIEDIISSKLAPYISIAWGTQRVYNNRYLFDFGIKFTFYPTIIGNSFKAGYNEYNYSSNNSTISHEKFVEIINKNAITRIQLIDLITFKIGVGTLIK